MVRRRAALAGRTSLALCAAPEKIEDQLGSVNTEVLAEYARLLELIPAQEVTSDCESSSISADGP
jgi:hypothetical protein